MNDEIIGNWVRYPKTEQMEEDSNCKIIHQKIAEEMAQIAVDESGWDSLYKEKLGAFYWELYFPYSEMHGGGPPALKKVSAEYVHKKYGIKV